MQRFEQQIRKEISKLLDEQKSQLEFYKNPDNAMEAFGSSLEKVATKLTHYKMIDLRSLLVSLQAKQLNLHSPDGSETNDGEIGDFYNVSTRLLSRIIEIKREKHQQLTHPMVKKIVEFPVFSASNPHVGSDNRDKIQTENGTLEVKRKGLRNAIYRNSQVNSGSQLTIFDQSVMLGIQKLWLNRVMTNKIQEPIKEISFHFSELMEAMEREVNSGLYDKIEESLLTLFSSDTTLVLTDDPYTNEPAETELYHFFTKMRISHARNSATVIFSDDMIQGLYSNDFISISMAQLNDFQGSTAALLYPLLHLWVQEGKKHFELDLDELIGHVNLLSSHRSKAVGIIQTAFNEMKEFDIIRDFSTIKVGNKYALVRFEFHENYLENYQKHRITILKDADHTDWTFTNFESGGDLN